MNFAECAFGANAMVVDLSSPSTPINDAVIVAAVVLGFTSATPVSLTSGNVDLSTNTRAAVVWATTGTPACEVSPFSFDRKMPLLAGNGPCDTFIVA